MSNQPQKILLITSNPQEQEKFSHYLTEIGYQVTLLEQSRLNPDSSGGGHYDVILFAPCPHSKSIEMDCIQILRNYFEIPFILLVNKEMTHEEIKLCLDSGAVDFIPFNANQTDIALRIEKTIHAHIMQMNERNLRRELIIQNMELEDILKKRTRYLKTSITQLRHNYEENGRLFRWLTAENQTLTIGSMTKDLTHIFNNMLQVILGHISILKQKQESIPQKSITALSSAAEQAAKVIKHLISYIQESGYNGNHININQLINNCLELYQSIVRDKFCIQTSFEDKVPFIHGDRSNLQFVIMNLLLFFKNIIPRYETLYIETKYTPASSLNNSSWVSIEIDCPTILEGRHTTMDYSITPSLTIENNIHMTIIQKIIDENHGKMNFTHDEDGRAHYTLTFPAQFHKKTVSQINNTRDESMAVLSRN